MMPQVGPFIIFVFLGYEVLARQLVAIVKESNVSLKMMTPALDNKEGIRRAGHTLKCIISLSVIQVHPKCGKREEPLLQ